MTDRTESTECRNRCGHFVHSLWRRSLKESFKEATSKIKTRTCKRCDDTGFVVKKDARARVCVYTPSEVVFVFTLPGQNYLTRLKIIESAETRTYTYVASSIGVVRINISVSIIRFRSKEYSRIEYNWVVRDLK